MTVAAQCAYDTSIFTINPTSASNKIYNVGTASAFSSISNFTLSSTAVVCTSSDIVYTMSISPNTTFVTFSPSISGGS